MEDEKKDETAPTEMTEEEFKEYRLTHKGRIPDKVATSVQEYRAQRKALSQILAPRNQELFLKEFIANGGNGTAAALRVWPNLTRVQANSRAHSYLRKLKPVARIYMEERGASYGKLLEIAIDKAYSSRTPEWWDRLMKLADYDNFMDKPEKGTTNVQVNIQQIQKDLMSEYVDGEEEPEGVVIEEEK